MIIFIEQRDLVAESFSARFARAGQTLVRLNPQDALAWLRTDDLKRIATAEAFLIGECEGASNIVQKIREKLDVPIVALLDNRNLQKLLEFYNSGADDVVSKPVHCEELTVRMAAIRMRNFTPEIVNEIKPITVYLDGRDPLINGEELTLPRRERRILEYLASLNGRRATKAQIFDAVYGVFEENIEENVVESHLSKLRKKLRTLLGKDPIDSKRYLGYQLDPYVISFARGESRRLVA